MATLTAEDTTDLTLVNQLRTMYAQARDHRRSYHEAWNRNYRLLNNRQNVRGTTSWQAQPKDSEIYPTIATLVAWMADQNTIIDIAAAADPSSPFANIMQGMAEDLSVVLASNWLVLDHRAQIKLGLWDAFQYGIGIFKNVWDDTLDGGAGNAIMRRCDPWAIYVDPHACNFDDAEFICEARHMSMNAIFRRWPEARQMFGDDGVSDSPTDIDTRPSYSSTVTVNRPLNLGNLQSNQSSPTRWSNPKSSNNNRYTPSNGLVVYEFWVRNGSDWRVIVVAGGRILMDEPATALWSHGDHPYERYVYDDIGEFYGITLLDHLASPQIYLNRLLTAMQQNAELIGNPVFVEPSNAGIDRVNTVNRPGARIKVNAGAMQTPPFWLQPPQMSQNVQDMIQFWLGRLDNTSGMTQAVRGQAPTSRTPEGILTTTQEAAFVRVRAGLANLESTLRKCGYKLCDLIIENYNDDRYLAVVGPGGAQTAKFLKANHFNVLGPQGKLPLKYSLNINAGAGSPTSQQARIAEADQLFAMGAIDRQAVLEAHNYPGWTAIANRISQQEAVGAFNPPGARQRAQRTS